MKAQVWSLDFALSLVIFMTSLFAVIFAWNYISVNALENQAMKDLQVKALALSDSLIRTRGIPLDWNESTVEVVGLAQDQNVLDVSKVGLFIDMSIVDEDQLKGLMDIGLHDFYFEVRDINGTVYANTTTPVSTASPIVVPIERYAIYDERIVKVNFVLWE
ncbi:MAG: hypothetical protein JXC85_03820 [Candidatus Aenigmarchaeota archaeon]|nr:hypothetical protein [Candidatus Aenigmarchaeota archaeon]